MAMRTFDPLLPVVTLLLGILYPTLAVQPPSSPAVSVANRRMSFALLVVRLPLAEVVVEAAPLLTEPSATPELAAPEISNAIIPGLITPPEAVKRTLTRVRAAELAM